LAVTPALLPVDLLLVDLLPVDLLLMDLLLLDLLLLDPLLLDLLLLDPLLLDPLLLNRLLLDRLLARGAARLEISPLRLNVEGVTHNPAFKLFAYTTQIENPSLKIYLRG
jgi:hypothetical protein